MLSVASIVHAPFCRRRRERKVRRSYGIQRIAPIGIRDQSSSESRISRHTLLFVAPVWPERSSSAAGVRTSDLIGKLKATWNVHFLR